MKILIADDHPIMRFGMQQLLQKEWPDSTVLEADTIDAALRHVREQAPFDVVVLDLVMPDVAGTEGVSRMLRAAGSTPILVVSANSESAFAARLLKMGVSGYLPKDRAADELIEAVHRLKAGRRFVTAEMSDHLVDILGGKPVAKEAHEQLSTQEHRVMLLMAAGRAPSEIAETMHLSVKTVGTYRARIFEKMGWKNNVELTKYCLQHGLTDQI